MNWNMRRIRPKEIAFDIDGVVANTIGAFIKEAREKYGIVIRYEDIKEYELSKAVNMREEILIELAKKILYEPLEMGIRPIRGAIEVLKRLSNRTELLFVTARPDKKGIEKWLKRYLDGTRFYVIATGRHEEKANLLKEYGKRYFVEDRLETCYILKDSKIIPIVFEQPWNRKPHPFIKVKNWRELEEIIEWN